MEEKFQKVINIFKATTRRDCYSIELLDEEPEILDDKIGGKPYLPVGEEYPLDNEGNPLALLLQINLKNIDLEEFPNDGILEIFTDKDLNYPCSYSVKYFKEGLEYQTNLPKINLHDYIVRRGYKISYKKSNSYMSSSDYRFPKLMSSIINKVYGTNLENMDDIENFFNNYDWYDSMTEQCETPFITLGGYPDFTQEDPRASTRFRRDECVFKLDSNYDYKKINIGDAGILFALIGKTNLKNRIFDKTFVSWDCC